jgi:S-DNA-T family DNA segregation ATPase FtsK/SpoIIIE
MMKEMYNLPPVDLLCKSEDAGVTSFDVEETEYIKRRITEILKSFGIEICRITATIGPVVTLYEITPKRGVRMSNIRGQEDDIALSLKALGVRVIAPMPGKRMIGIEVPNPKPCQVRLRDVVETPEFQKADMELPVAVGLLCGCDRCGPGVGNTSFALRGDGQPA